MSVAGAPNSDSAARDEGAAPPVIRFREASKFYGEVLGIHRVDLSIGPGITSLVGPNGAGKTTILNLAAGLLRPTEGSVEVLGSAPHAMPELFHRVGYATQFDTFPRSMSGFDFVERYLRLHGMPREEASARASRSIARVGMSEAAPRRIASYSKGMKQRIQLAQAIAHDPEVLLLDEPLNGLDPLARAESMELFRVWAAEGRTVVLSSHILHEVDAISDRVVLVHGGYIVAEGAIEGVREELAAERPLQVLVRCDRPRILAARIFSEDHTVEAKILEEGAGLLVRTASAERFFLLLNRLAAAGEIDVETVLPVDQDVQAVYEYLIGDGETAR